MELNISQKEAEDMVKELMDYGFRSLDIRLKDLKFLFDMYETQNKAWTTRQKNYVYGLWHKVVEPPLTDVSPWDIY